MFLKHPHLSFIDLREVAINWVESSRPGGKSRVRVLSCDTQCASVVEANASAVAVSSADEIAQIKESLCKQQSQLDAIMHHLNVQPLSSSLSKAATDPPRWPWAQAESKPVCHRCRKPGHIARFCRVNLKNVGRRALSTSEVISNSQVMGEGPSFQPSEN